MMRRMAAAALAAVALVSCSSKKEGSTPTPTAPLLQQTTTSSTPTTAVVAKVLSPEQNSVQGSGGRGMVVVLTFTAKDPSALPADFRLGGSLPSPAPAAKTGHNPAFPGLVVGLSTTTIAAGGPSANLANLFQIVSPAKQPDGSVQVTAGWTNTQPNFGTDLDATLVAFTVTGAAPDVIPASPADMGVNSNPAQVTFHVSAADDTASASSTSTTTGQQGTSTTAKGTTTTTKPGTTASSSSTTTTKPGATTTRPT